MILFSTLIPLKISFFPELIDDKIKERTKEYFEELLNVEKDRTQRNLQQRAVRDVQDISEEEVRDAIRNMKIKKTVGPDNIPTETWKCLGREGIEWLTKLLGKVWRKSVSVPLFQEKGRQTRMQKITVE